MGWELTEVNVDDSGGQASAFHFEVTFTGSHDQAECLLRGDGILLSNGRIRFNRSADLIRTVTDLGLSPDELIRKLEGRVRAIAPPRLTPIAQS